MKKFRIQLMIFAVIIIIAQLFITDYSDLSWSNNSGSYLGIFSMICVITAMVLSGRHEKKHG